MQETEMDFREETKLQVGMEINEECSDFSENCRNRRSLARTLLRLETLFDMVYNLISLHPNPEACSQILPGLKLLIT